MLSAVAVPSEFPQAAKYAPHHYLCYTLQPGYSKGGTRHNSLGFRGPEIAIPKPAGRFRIVALGGSTTYTEFVENDADSFPARLESALRRRMASDRFEVVNAGCPGYNSWESLATLQYRALELEPDLVILYDGVNDVHARLVHPDAYAGDNSGRRRPWTPPLQVRICQYSVLVRLLGACAGLWRLPGVDAYVQAPTSDPGSHGPSDAYGDPLEALAKNPPIHTRRNLQSMIAITRAHGAVPILATWAHSPLVKDYSSTPHYERGIAEHNAVVREVAEETGALCFDFAERMPIALEYWRDGRHVNRRGAEIQGELFAEFLLASGALRARPAEEPIRTPGGR